jgi:hypothetical protein
VIETIGRLNAALGHLSLAKRAAILLAVVALVSAASLPIAYGRDGVAGLAAVAIAAGVCGACSMVGLILATRGQGTPSGVAFALSGSLVGMLPPLFVGMLLQQSESAVARAGAFGWIVVFYLATLLAKTLLVVPSIQPVAVKPSTPVGPTQAGA